MAEIKTEKELREEIMNEKCSACRYNTVGQDEYIHVLEDQNRELESQIEKLIDFVLSKTECCDVCPITDTCINSEGTCPYAGILAKGEEEVTREWLMQFISKEK